MFTRFCRDFIYEVTWPWVRIQTAIFWLNIFRILGYHQSLYGL